MISIKKGTAVGQTTYLVEHFDIINQPRGAEITYRMPSVDIMGKWTKKIEKILGVK